ncbi:hypothetical protein D3C85_832800 [compost metagenome]
MAALFLLDIFIARLPKELDQALARFISSGIEQFTVENLGIEKVFSKLRKLACAEHGLVADQQRRRYFQIPVLVRLQVEHELADGAFQTRQLALEHSKARAGHLSRSLKVQQAHGLA